MSGLLEQMNTIYESNQTLALEKQTTYMRHYLEHLEVLDYVLVSNNTKCTYDYLKHLKHRMDVDDVYLFNDSGVITRSSNRNVLGLQLEKNEDTEFVWELMENPDVANTISIQDDNVIPGITTQDYFFKRTELPGFALVAIGISREILPKMEAEISVDKFLQESPVEDGNCFMIVDKETKEVLGSTRNRDYFEYINQIYEEKDLLEQLRTSEETYLFHADNAYLLAKSKILDDVFLVCLTKMDEISYNVKIQAVFFGAVLALTAVILIILIRRHFHRYVFEEFEKIDNTIGSLISGDGDAEFGSSSVPELQEVITSLNHWKSTFSRQEQQISDTALKLREARIASEHDSLTGLINRYGFEKRIRPLLGKSAPAGVLLMMDLDNFKNLNDSLGHPEGDNALKLTASFLKNEFRNIDLIARLGGDEFVVYIYNPPVLEHEVLEARLHDILNHLHKLLPGKYLDCGLSLSIGAVYVNGETSYEDLYRQVDEALYEAKENGKGQFVIH